MKQNIYSGDGDRGEGEYEIEYLTFPELEQFSCVRHLFSTRLGGVSEGIFATMNLSFTRGDDERAVTENFARIARVLGTSPKQIVCTDQTHTTNVRVVTKEDCGKGIFRKRDYTDVDGLITKEKGVVLATFYADCVPLYFVDPVKEVIGLSHSGWRGTADGMGRVTVTRMQQEFGCRPEDIYAAIGPSICKECYEVSNDVAEAFERAFSENEYLRENDAFAQIISYRDEAQKAEGKCQLDLHLANKWILLSAGILTEHISVTDVCTAHNPDYLFSHRKTDGKRGNLGAFLYLV
ncbi:MAG: peptidoglycan editing factor PgeF [Lachnospiraceae bacterium]|nr:peptidoglycan editing factor PgeF [Lachnospiraceae bacterium]